MKLLKSKIKCSIVWDDKSVSYYENEEDAIRELRRECARKRVYKKNTSIRV